MKNDCKKKSSLNFYLDCFDNFNFSDPICRKYCSLNLRCAIESNQKDKMELLEDMVTADVSLIRFH